MTTLRDEIEFDLENIQDRLKVVQAIDSVDYEIPMLRYRIKRLKLYLKMLKDLENF